MVTTVDLAWAAGFLEGEGSFRFSQRDTGRPHGTPTVTAAQKDPESLKRLHTLFSGNVPTPYIARVNRKECRVYQWRIYGERAVGVMYALYPWMSGYRKAQIRAAISGWRGAPGQNKPRLKCRRGHDTSTPELRAKPTKRQRHGQCLECRKLYARA